MAERKDTSEEFNPRHRIVGAVILVALAVIFLPMLLSDRPPAPAPNTVTSAPVPENRAVPAPSPSADSRSTGGTHMPESGKPSGRRTVTIPVEPVGTVKGIASPQPVKSEVPAASATAKSTPAPKAETKNETKPEVKSRTAVATSKPVAREKGWFVQVGVFSQLENAKRLQERIRQKGYDVRIDPSAPAAGKPVRVEVGPYRHASDAKSAATRIQNELGIKGLVRSH